MRRSFAFRAQVIAALVVPCFLLLSVDASRGIAAMRAMRAERARIVEMAERLGLDPQMLLDPDAYQARIAREAEKERDLQVFWMRERTKPDPDKVAWVERTVEEVENAYALSELAALADDMADLDGAIADQLAGRDATMRLVALERASLRHHGEVMTRFDRAMQAKMTHLPWLVRARHEGFMRSVRRDVGTVAKELARLTDAKPVGEAANIKQQRPVSMVGLQQLRPKLAEVAGARQPAARLSAEPPAERAVVDAVEVQAPAREPGLFDAGTARRPVPQGRSTRASTPSAPPWAPRAPRPPRAPWCSPPPARPP